MNRDPQKDWWSKPKVEKPKDTEIVEVSMGSSLIDKVGMHYITILTATGPKRGKVVGYTKNAYQVEVPKD